MRAIELIHASEAHTLATPIFDENSKILLSRGVKLKASLVEKLIQLGYTRVYIRDEHTESDIEDVISPEVRQKSIGHIRKLSALATRQNGSKNVKEEFEKDLTFAKASISSIVDDLFTKKDVVIELMDLKTVGGYIYEHSINVMVLSLILGTSIGLNRSDLDKLALAASLHDIGLMFVPQELLNKDTPLTKSEFEIVKRHPLLGFEFLKKSTNLSPLVRIPVLQHHETYNGKGYPKQLDHSKVHLFSKIIGIVDAFDAMTSDRPHRKALPVFEVIEFIMASGGTLFDPELVKAFIQRINPYPLNTIVKLNDGSVGVVAKVNKDLFSRPVIRLIRTKSKENSRIINLIEEKNLVIQGIVHKA
ncbi:HD-GYP domain-containing protein [Serpentinicella sp. ANB-PHB4]|uniref:HD-GYP domain-containing protein n=1 Tax=Serpentinicella sp. ANB-PHB4 TaxID=3074076 RepID=UPI002855A5F2|nr:HD-GYP domain-containing protein [Serpentinicella sp. ANB-PHB4]MDR5659125.1 HD-GYP domain-containing protein [Serpentinicella sp. ANB-PHB4]